MVRSSLVRLAALTAVAGLPAYAAAQDAPAEPAPAVEVTAVAAEVAPVALAVPVDVPISPLLAEVVANVETVDLSLADQLRAAIAIPVAADEARDAGEDPAQVADAVQALDESDVRADVAVAALTESATATRVHGRVDSFGAFVRARIGEGLRGRALAAAIRAEHEARGIGRGRGRDDDHDGTVDEGGETDEHGRADERPRRGRPEGVGRPEGGEHDHEGAEGEAAGGEGDEHEDDEHEGDEHEGRGRPEGAGERGRGHQGR